MVEFLMNEKPGFGIMFGLLVAKFLFGAICFACGAPGGTLYPLCILGTYLGAAFGSIALQITGLPDGLWQEFAVIGMAGFFSATIKSPITGVVLVFELTGNMNNILPLVTVALISYAVSNHFGQRTDIRSTPCKDFHTDKRKSGKLKFQKRKNHQIICYSDRKRPCRQKNQRY